MAGEHDHVELVLARLEALPTLPTIASRLLEITSDERFDLGEVAGLIEGDPSLSARVLAMCRRAELGLGDRITTIRRAVLMLGIDSVRSAVLSVCVFDLLRREGGERADLTGMWRFALGVACCCEQIAREHPRLRVAPDEAFLGGLLHDLGRIALCAVLPESMSRVRELAARRGVNASLVEREVLGVDHLVAGKRLGERWGLPEGLLRCIWLHELDPGVVPEDEHAPMLRMLLCARAIARELHVGDGGDFGATMDWRRRAHESGLESTGLERISRRLHGLVAERCHALGVGDEAPSALMLESIARANESLARQVARMRARSARDARAMQALREIETLMQGEDDDPAVIVEQVVASAGRWFGVDHMASIREKEGGIEQRAWHGGVSEPASFEGAGEVLEIAEGEGVHPLSTRLSDAIAGPLGRAGRLMRALRVGSVVLVSDGIPRDLDAPGKVLACVWGSLLRRGERASRAARLAESLSSANATIAQMQEVRAREESMRRLGEMTAGAAHEMNNPLTTISGQAQRLLMRLEGEQREMCARIVEAAHELGDLVCELHELAQAVRLDEGVWSVRDILGRALDLAHEGRCRLDVPDVELVCDGEACAQALCELIRNARRADPDGVIAIRAETAGVDGRLRLVVSDAGPGLSARARMHAFDPFFSDQEAGRGRGLGLTRARRLIEAMGGEIGLAERAGGGTDAWIELDSVSRRVVKESA